MPLLNPQQAFGLSCPSGGTWYACSSGVRFVGCCGTYPCDSGCPDGNLEPATFNSSEFPTDESFNKLSDQSCVDASTKWWKCNFTSPPFLGCCSIDPCNSTVSCPRKNLVQGELSDVPALAAPYLTGISTSSVPVRPIVGGVIGGVALVIGVIVSWIYRRRQSRRSRLPAQETIAATPTPKSSIAEMPTEAVANCTFPTHDYNDCIDLSDNTDCFLIVSSPPPRYSKILDSTQDSIELADTPTHRNTVAELSAVVAPAELEANAESAPHRNKPWTQSTVSSEAMQSGGLGIRHLAIPARFSSQSEVSEIHFENDSPNMQTEDASVSEISQQSSPSHSTSPFIHQDQPKSNSIPARSPLSHEY